MGWGRSAGIFSAVALAALAPRALALGIGAEVGAVATQLSGGGASMLWGPTGGIVIEEMVPLSIVFLDPWLDLQAPLQLAPSAPFLAIDLGLRLGLGLGLVQPYIGVLGQLNILLDSAQNDGAKNDVLGGFGGDVGVDFAFSMFRLGVEGRSVFLPVVYQGDFGQSATEFELLASARFSF